MERSVAKITLDVSIKNEIETDDGTYIFEKDENDVIAYIYNGARTGLIDGMAAADKRNYTRLSDGKAVYTLGYKAAESSPVGSSDYTLKTPFYSYPNEWESESSSNETTLRLKVPWKKSGEREWTTYYYRVPINDVDHKLDRNTHYRIKLNVGMLGSKVPSTPVTLDDLTYEILSWSEDDIDLMQDLSTAQYLVVEENTFELVNTSDAVIRYNSSAVLSGVYLRSVSYYSTSYNDTVYLYDTNNDETYTETSSYSPNSKSVQAKYSTAVSEIKDNVKNALGFESDMSGDTYLGSGQINFSANVQNIAAEVYRPVTYTIVLVASDINSRVTVKLTQYPARYIEFGNAGNAFVNGYFGNLNLDDGYSSDSLPEGATYATTVSGSTYGNGNNDNPITVTVNCYHSLSFIYDGYDSEGAYYRSTSTNLSADSDINYGDVRDRKNGTGGPGAGNMGGINTSYEYLRGTLGTSVTLSFKNTIDVTVSAFSGTTSKYTIGNHTGDYIIGDPRVESGYEADTHHETSSYEYLDNHLYDYLVSGVKSGNYYYRYVKSWGTDAAKIKVGGRDASFDDVIAPMYKIQSSIGAAAGLAYYKVAEKRCATYQEAGYPAGRWRLPTFAELAFLIELQQNGVITQMITTNNTNGYWTSSGKAVYLDKTGNTAGYHNYGLTSTNACYVRCVYDTWYWGNKQTLPTHQYHPMP
jgi:hypothetical protein